MEAARSRPWCWLNLFSGFDEKEAMLCAFGHPWNNYLEGFDDLPPPPSAASYREG